MKHNDITANKHGGNPESIAAHEAVEPSITEIKREIMYLISRYGGSTSKDAAQWFDVELNTISGRFTELKRDGMIKTTGERRDGCAVLRLTEKGKQRLKINEDYSSIV